MELELRCVMTSNSTIGFQGLTWDDHAHISTVRNGSIQVRKSYSPQNILENVTDSQLLWDCNQFTLIWKESSTTLPNPHRTQPPSLKQPNVFMIRLLVVTFISFEK